MGSLREIRVGFMWFIWFIGRLIAGKIAWDKFVWKWPGFPGQGFEDFRGRGGTFADSIFFLLEGFAHGAVSQAHCEGFPAEGRDVIA